MVPAVRKKFPRHRSQKVVLRNDTALPPIISDNYEVLAACHDAPVLKTVFQSAESRAFKVLYLEFFLSIQSLQIQTNATEIDDLVGVFAEGFHETSFVTPSKVWLSLQRCIEEAMKFKRGKRYRMPHGDRGGLLSQLYQ